MPTRPQTWRFRKIYEDFRHEGLRTTIDPEGTTPINRPGRLVRVDGLVFDEDDTQVGHFTRLLGREGDGLRVRHERVELVPAVRGRGFARALHSHAEAVYVRMGVRYVTMHAEDVGSLLWPRLGFDFDLRKVQGDTEEERRARAVLRLLSPSARQVVGRLRPAQTLTEWSASEDAAQREAAAAMRARLPTRAGVQAGNFEGLLLDPVALAQFDAGGTGLGRTLMLGASWDAIKTLTADGDPEPGAPPASGVA